MYLNLFVTIVGVESVYLGRSVQPGDYIPPLGVKRDRAFSSKLLNVSQKRFSQAADPKNHRSLARSLSKVGRFRRSLGRWLQKVGKHLPGRTFFLWAGYHIEGKKPDWEKIWPSAYSDVEGEGEEPVRIRVINGIKVPERSIVGKASRLAKEVGQPVHYTWNASRGFWHDAVQAVFNWFGSKRTHKIPHLLTELKSDLRAGKPVLWVAHSHGALLANLALKEAAKEKLSLKNFRVVTLGSPLLIGKEFNAINYVCRGDTIGQLNQVGVGRNLCERYKVKYFEKGGHKWNKYYWTPTFFEVVKARMAAYTPAHGSD